MPSLYLTGPQAKARVLLHRPKSASRADRSKLAALFSDKGGMESVGSEGSRRAMIHLAPKRTRRHRPQRRSEVPRAALV
jgi:hypothetical protein